ncbi:zinc ABC transporter substrate-binding protein [Rhodovulum sp. FJ3]|uniref:zinc ABC transporter substrate-binding protein n=1 Tax=Rhodovulum sp. FJ3 TaxID=3079053 RepID=UPI00293DF751|nr:zinc ABC transporter substrate-binding protein [Rhodovulum sp. FJ3]MDV4169340.1 zinc ABC transporter substrate-binding protein [Rhodovulum sp. FJ3]
MSTKLYFSTALTALFAGSAMAAPPEVSVDIAPVHSLVAQVMGDLGEPNLIVSNGASPHEYALRPSQAGDLQNAGLVFFVSPDLTPWLVDAVDNLATNAKVIELIEADGTATLPFREGALFEAHDHDDDHDEHHEGHDDHEHHDEHHDEHEEHHDEHHDDHEDHEAHHDEDHHDAHDHHGHDHDGVDPHAWLSPANAAAWIDVIAAELIAADPDNAVSYRANAAKAKSGLDALNADITATLAPVQGKGFVVFHDAYQYFETAFDIPATGSITVSDSTDPSPARIRDIQTRVAENNVACVLSEPQFDPGIVDAVMQGSPANTGVIDPLGAHVTPGPDHYGQMMRDMAGSLATCLSGS